MPIQSVEGFKYFTPKYEKLYAPPNLEKGRQIAKEFLRYAGYMQGDVLHGDASSGFEAVSWNGLKIEGTDTIFLSPTVPSNLKNIIRRLENLGFKEDGAGGFYDTKTGTIFHMIEDITDPENPEIVLCFEGLGNEQSLDVDRKTRAKIGSAGASAAFREFMGGLPKASRQAMEIGKILKEECANTNLRPVVVGHSHGGAIAQTAAASAGIKGIVFNSQPMGAKVRRKIGKETLKKNAPNITAFAGKHDWLSRTKFINKTAALAKRALRIPLPRTIGKGYGLPKAKNRPKEINRLLFHHVAIYDQLHALLKKP